MLQESLIEGTAAWYSSSTEAMKSTICRNQFEPRGQDTNVRARGSQQSKVALTSLCLFWPSCFPGFVFSLSWMCTSLSWKCCTAVEAKAGSSAGANKGLEVKLARTAGAKVPEMACECRDPLVHCSVIRRTAEHPCDRLSTTKRVIAESFIPKAPMASSLSASCTQCSSTQFSCHVPHWSCARSFFSVDQETLSMT